MLFHEAIIKYIEGGGSLDDIISTPLREELSQLKYVAEDGFAEAMKAFLSDMNTMFEKPDKKTKHNVNDT